VLGYSSRAATLPSPVSFLCPSNLPFFFATPEMSAEIADILSRVSLDPTRNPWQFISHELELIFYPPMPPGIVENLYIVAVLLAL